MSCNDPTREGEAIALTIPARHVAFLRETFTIARDGLLGDLAEHPDQLLNPKYSRREAATYGRLLGALNTCAIVPDDDVRGTLRTLAITTDASNEYGRVVLEHCALYGLLGQIEAVKNLGRAPAARKEGR